MGHGRSHVGRTRSAYSNRASQGVHSGRRERQDGQEKRAAAGVGRRAAPPRPPQGCGLQWRVGVSGAECPWGTPWMGTVLPPAALESFRERPGPLGPLPSHAELASCLSWGEKEWTLLSKLSGGSRVAGHLWPVHVFQVRLFLFPCGPHPPFWAWPNTELLRETVLELQAGWAPQCPSQRHEQVVILSGFAPGTRQQAHCPGALGEQSVGH